MKSTLQLLWHWGIISRVLNAHIWLLHRIQKRTNRLIALERCVMHSTIPVLSDNPDDDERDRIHFISKLADYITRSRRCYYRDFR